MCKLESKKEVKTKGVNSEIVTERERNKALEQKLRNKHKAKKKINIPLLKLHCSMSCDVSEDRPHRPRPCRHISRLSGKRQKSFVGNVHLSFPTGHLWGLVFENGRLEQFPNSVLRWLLGNLLNPVFGITFRSNQVYPDHSTLVPHGTPHLSSCPFLFFFLKISVSWA